MYDQTRSYNRGLLGPRSDVDYGPASETSRNLDKFSWGWVMGLFLILGCLLAYVYYDRPHVEIDEVSSDMLMGEQYLFIKLRAVWPGHSTYGIQLQYRTLGKGWETTRDTQVLLPMSKEPLTIDFRAVSKEAPLAGPILSRSWVVRDTK